MRFEDCLPERLVQRTLTPAQGVLQQIKDEATGKRYAVEWPFTLLSSSTKALLPSTVTLVCGTPGSGKSWFMVQALTHWISKGIRVAMLELEADRKFHLRRALAQIAGAPHITDDVWCKENTEQAEYLYHQHAAQLEDVGSALYDSPNRPMACMDILNWIREMATKGARVICIDPITAMSPSQKPWIDDQMLLTEARKIVDAAGASLVLVTHPKKAFQGPPSLDSLAGGAAYGRFSDTAIWLKSIHPAEEKNCQTSMGTTSYAINRSVLLCKVRSGRGSGWELAYQFEPSTLTFIERGVIVDD